MKITNKEIINFLNTPVIKKRLPIRVAHAIAVNIEEANAKYKVYEANRISMVEKYAEKDENGEPIIENNEYVVSDVNLEKANKEVEELINVEVEMPVTTVTLDDLAKCDGSEFDSLTVAELIRINFMIEK